MEFVEETREESALTKDAFVFPDALGRVVNFFKVVTALVLTAENPGNALRLSGVDKAVTAPDIHEMLSRTGREADSAITWMGYFKVHQHSEDSYILRSSIGSFGISADGTLFLEPAKGKKYGWSEPVPLNVWYHFAMSVAPGGWEFYINGVSFGGETEFVPRSENVPTVFGQNFHGEIDNFVVFSVFLSDWMIESFVETIPSWAEPV